MARDQSNAQLPLLFLFSSLLFPSFLFPSFFVLYILFLYPSVTRTIAIVLGGVISKSKTRSYVSKRRARKREIVSLEVAATRSGGKRQRRRRRLKNFSNSTSLTDRWDTFLPETGHRFDRALPSTFPSRLVRLCRLFTPGPIDAIETIFSARLLG